MADDPGVTPGGVAPRTGMAVSAPERRPCPRGLSPRCGRGPLPPRDQRALRVGDEEVLGGRNDRRADLAQQLLLGPCGVVHLGEQRMAASAGVEGGRRQARAPDRERPRATHAGPCRSRGFRRRTASPRRRGSTGGASRMRGWGRPRRAIPRRKGSGPALRPRARRLSGWTPTGRRRWRARSCGRRRTRTRRPPGHGTPALTTSIRTVADVGNARNQLPGPTTAKDPPAQAEGAVPGRLTPHPLFRRSASPIPARWRSRYRRPQRRSARSARSLIPFSIRRVITSVTGSPTRVAMRRPSLRRGRRARTREQPAPTVADGDDVEGPDAVPRVFRRRLAQHERARRDPPARRGRRSRRAWGRSPRGRRRPGRPARGAATPRGSRRCVWMSSPMRFSSQS